MFPLRRGHPETGLDRYRAAAEQSGSAPRIAPLCTPFERGGSFLCGGRRPQGRSEAVCPYDPATQRIFQTGASGNGLLAGVRRQDDIPAARRVGWGREGGGPGSSS